MFRIQGFQEFACLGFRGLGFEGCRVQESEMC